MYLEGSSAIHSFNELVEGAQPTSQVLHWDSESSCSLCSIFLQAPSGNSPPWRCAIATRACIFVIAKMCNNSKRPNQESFCAAPGRVKWSRSHVSREACGRPVRPRPSMLFSATARTLRSLVMLPLRFVPRHESEWGSGWMSCGAEICARRWHETSCAVWRRQRH